MAFTVGENSYLSVADADTYWSDRNNSTWSAASDAEKEAALLEATQYLDKAYRWRGEHPGSSTQLLAWPRNNVVDEQGRTRTGIPQEIKDATAELALEALGGRLVPVQDHGGAVKSQTVNGLSIEYQDGAPANPSYDYVRMLVSPLIRRAGRRVVRT